MKHIILGTAGHVDHGKTSLVKAVSGKDTDRLKEEKERGITIELGFAWTDLPSGRRVGIVDVPGHERFVKNMVAGAGGIDIVVLVIAADEGVMPQTREHLEICSLLGIRFGLIALTKIDLVDEDWLVLVQEDIREFMRGTFLEGSPILPVSTVSGKGVPEFISVLDEAIARIPDRADTGFLRLPVDRVFTLKGFGTVVTGTLISGRISLGDNVDILPGMLSARVRGIQIHNENAPAAERGQRTAVNLQGVERSAVQRGDWVCRPGVLEPSRRIDAAFIHLGSAPRPLKNRSLVRFHSGTAETISRIILLDRDQIEPGKEAFAQILFESPVVAMSGDRFVVRSYSPVRTIGGGWVLDPLPGKHKRNSGRVLQDMDTLERGADLEKALVILDRAGFAGASETRLSVRAGLHPEKTREAIRRLLAEKKAVRIESDGERFVSASVYRDLQESLVATVKAYQARFPLKPGLSKEELKSVRGAPDPRLFNAALRDLENGRRILVEKDMVRTPDHRVELGTELQEIREKVLRIYLEAGATPPSVRDVLERFERKQSVMDVLNVMLKEEKLVKISEDMFFHREALEKLKSSYGDLLKKKGKAAPPDFREITGLSRKYIIPLMEYFDSAKFTIRVGDYRVLRNRG
ncbi:MAG TPA: selenocysteine-specific translation elongation factor [Syntrophales bacterium]|nr:selenocysteine-specific translation elongation factor [Syntrophales bacterium]